jgi:hypothetical protein
MESDISVLLGDDVLHPVWTRTAFMFSISQSPWTRHYEGLQGTWWSDRALYADSGSAATWFAVVGTNGSSNDLNCGLRHSCSLS